MCQKTPLEMSPRHNPWASSTVTLPPAACSGWLHSWRQVTFMWGQWTVLSLCAQGRSSRAKAVVFHQVLMGNGTLMQFLPLYFLSLLLPGEEYLSHKHQEVFSSLKPSSRPCIRIHAELYFSTFRLIMPCFCSPNSTWALDAYVVQRNSKEFLSPIFPWRQGCRSCCSQQEMHGKSLRTVFDLSLWICSKTHWNKKRGSHHLGTSDYRREELKK